MRRACLPHQAGPFDKLTLTIMSRRSSQVLDHQSPLGKDGSCELYGFDNIELKC